MTSAPRILAGEFSAAKIGTDEPFNPIPIPMRRRVMKSCSHDCERAPPIGVRRQNMALMKIVCVVVSDLSGERGVQRATDSTTAEIVVARIRDPTSNKGTANSQLAEAKVVYVSSHLPMYGPAFTSPTSQLSRIWFGAPSVSPSPMPNS